MSNPIQTVTLYSVPADFGHGANDGAYYPLGLVSMATYLQRVYPSIEVSIVDLHHVSELQFKFDIVGISASSTLNYRNVLKLVKKVKNNSSFIVLGGPHASKLAEQILTKRGDLIDFVIRGYGEKPFAILINALNNGTSLEKVPGLSWRNTKGTIIHNSQLTIWDYDQFTPLNLNLLQPGLKSYWALFREKINSQVDACFVLFTHFGCGYRQMMTARSLNSTKRFTKWCSYCSLSEMLNARNGKSIVFEILDILKKNNIPINSNILLKCYGDNVGNQMEMIKDLRATMLQNPILSEYKLGWTFYAQSSRLSDPCMKLLKEIGTRYLYIGFDSADNEIQRMNGLGTSNQSHWNAVRLCMKYNIRIQAGFVVGCAGETKKSIHNTLRFAEELASYGVLERINSAVLVIIPGSPAYSLLVEKEPWIKSLDLLPTDELQWYWIKHFCPNLGKNPIDGLQILKKAADYLDNLSPGPHASMGFISERLKNISNLTSVYQ